ncbi:MAG: hypothetical protein RL660_2041 [Bacteroidota bacterium]|jgi:hypothetical protein
MTIRKTVFAATCLLAAICINSTSHGQSITPDARIKRQLDGLKVKYEVNESTGNFKVLFSMDNDRTQQVIIKSKPATFGGYEYREVYSVAAGKPTLADYSQETLMTLMNMNYTNKVGYWQIDGESGAPFTLEFTVRMSASAGDDQLESLIKLCALQAEKMELKLTTQDKY